MTRTCTLRRAVRIALTAAAVGDVGALHAQEPPPPPGAAERLEEVVVTGTRLPTPNATSVSPITSVSAAEILQTGLTRVEDVLGQLPMIFPGMNSTVNNGADGTASINLRGLGLQRTLVLVDGARLGPGSADGRNWSDINQMPVALIERIDVLTGGASAVYGADAVAGVVNLIINTHFEGIRVDATYHFNQHNNANQDGIAPLLTAAGDPLPPSDVNTAFGKSASLIMGSNFADNAGNATAYVTYDNQSATLESKFDYSACTPNPTPANPPYQALACSGSVVSRGGWFFASSFSGATLIQHTVDPKTGVFRPFVQPNDLYNYGPSNYFQVPNERWTAGTFVNYELGSQADVYTNVMYMRNSMTAQVAPSGDFTLPSFTPCADPLLTAQEVATLCTASNLAANGGAYEIYNGKEYPGLDMYIGRRNVEGGNRITGFVNDAVREVIGVKGGSATAWTYNVYAQQSTVDIASTSENQLGNFQIQQALNVLPGPHGPVCGGPTGLTGPLVSSGTAFAPNPQCVPWNIWVPNGVSPAALAFMTLPFTSMGSVIEQVVSGSVTGEFGKYGVRLPWAEQGLQLNVGAEWREERSAYLPDYEEQQGNVGGVPGAVLPVAGEFTVREIFSEMRLPLATDRRFADDLSLEGGYRYSSYSDGFITHTYKAGLQWAPVRDIRLRGSYQHAVRAPNISELFYPQLIAADGSTDPCTGPTPSASLAACELTGVKPGQYGHIVPSPLSQYNGLGGGNPALRPESSDTYTAGLVLQPRLVEDLQVSIDYFNIKIDGVIGGIGADIIMTECLASIGNPAQAAQFCPLIHRDAQGSLWLTPAGYVSDLGVNVGELATAGIDINGSYRLPLPGAGSLLFTLVGTYLESLQSTPVAGFGSYDCVGYFGSACGTPNPKWRSLFNANWSTPWRGLDLNLRWRYIGPGVSAQTSTNPILSGNDWWPPLAHIPAYSYFDLAGTVMVSGNLRMELGINNLADKAPPLVVGADCGALACNGNTFPGVYDAMGRYLFMHITAQW
jgi:iron complex outermembrane recepter protein